MYFIYGCVQYAKGFLESIYTLLDSTFHRFYDEKNNFLQGRDIENMKSTARKRGKIVTPVTKNFNLVGIFHFVTNPR